MNPLTQETHPAYVLVPADLAAEALGVSTPDLTAAIDNGALRAFELDGGPAVTLRDVAQFHRDRAYRQAREGGDPEGNNRLLDHDESMPADPEVLQNWTGDFEDLRGYTDHLYNDLEACDRLFSDRREAFLVGRYLGQLDTHAQLTRYVRDWGGGYGETDARPGLPQHHAHGELLVSAAALSRSAQGGTRRARTDADWLVAKWPGEFDRAR